MHTAVEIFAVIKTLGKPDEMLIVRQFRPPLMKDLLELPAGLVDAGESCSQAALRELKEETGSLTTPSSNAVMGALSFDSTWIS